MLFDLFSTDFTPRHCCGDWSPFWLKTYIYSAFIFACDYLAIGIAFWWNAYASRMETQKAACEEHSLELLYEKDENESAQLEGVSRIEPRVVAKHPLSDTERFKILIAFGAFTFVCGMGHLIEDVMAFFVPMYHVFAAWRLLIAVVSTYAAWLSYRYKLKVATGI